MSDGSLQTRQSSVVAGQRSLSSGSSQYDPVIQPHIGAPGSLARHHACVPRALDGHPYGSTSSGCSGASPRSRRLAGDQFPIALARSLPSERVRPTGSPPPWCSAASAPASLSLLWRVSPRPPRLQRSPSPAGSIVASVPLALAVAALITPFESRLCDRAEAGADQRFASVVLFAILAVGGTTDGPGHLIMLVALGAASCRCCSDRDTEAEIRSGLNGGVRFH